MKKVLDYDNFTLINGDCFKVIKSLEANSVDRIFADPPYFLSKGGVSCHSGSSI